MATVRGKLTDVMQLTENQFEDMMGYGHHQSYEYSMTDLHLITPQHNFIKTLWTNPNPLTAMTPQFINIADSSNYKFLIIWSLLDAYQSCPIVQTKVLNPFYNGADYDTNIKNRRTFFTCCITSDGQSYDRHIRMMGPTILFIQYGYYSVASGSPQYTQWDTSMIPFQIVGSNLL